jgi:hypothetical protein
MADEHGKAGTERVTRDAPIANGEALLSNPDFEKYLLPGPWTEELEETFQWVIREFGEGHGGRDSDL